VGPGEVSAGFVALRDHEIAPGARGGDRRVHRTHLPGRQAPAGVNTVHEIAVGLAVEELHQRGAIDRHLQRRGVSVEIEERRYEVDPDRPVRPGADSIKGSR